VFEKEHIYEAPAPEDRKFKQDVVALCLAAEAGSCPCLKPILRSNQHGGTSWTSVAKPTLDCHGVRVPSIRGAASRLQGVLGSPGQGPEGVTKEGRFVARELTYYIRKLKKNLVNENFDRFLTLSFDHRTD